jgi:hypothetical protein
MIFAGDRYFGIMGHLLPRFICFFTGEGDMPGHDQRLRPRAAFGQPALEKQLVQTDFRHGHIVTALARRQEFGHDVWMKIRFSLLALSFLTAACSIPVVPERTPAPQPVALPPIVKPAPQAISGQWIDWPITPGDWVYRSDERGSVALFGAAGRDALVTMRCDRGRGKIYLARADETGSGGGGMTIRSSSALKQFSAQPTGAKPAYVAVEITPDDRFLDAMVYTRGRIAIETTGQQSIAVPVWTEIAKIVEDCRG